MPTLWAKNYIWNKGCWFMMDIRVRNISDRRAERLKAIARVKHGQTSMQDFVNTLLAQEESKYTPEQLIAIQNLYEHIKDEG